MADVDTIVVLNGLQNAKDTNDDIFTMDGDGENYESVKTYVVELPPEASGANVIFNGNYDPDGARHMVRVHYIALTDPSTPTKTENTIVLDWTEIDPDGNPTDEIKETGAIDVSGHVTGSLCIDVAVAEAEATTGLEVIVMVRGYTGLDIWNVLTRFIGPVGTATKADFADSEAAGQTTLSVTNPTAANLNHVGKFIFIEDTGTAADSEIAFIIDCGADA